MHLQFGADGILRVRQWAQDAEGGHYLWAPLVEVEHLGGPGLLTVLQAEITLARHSTMGSLLSALRPWRREIFALCNLDVYAYAATTPALVQRAATRLWIEPVVSIERRGRVRHVHTSWVYTAHQAKHPWTDLETLWGRQIVHHLPQAQWLGLPIGLRTRPRMDGIPAEMTLPAPPRPTLYTTIICGVLSDLASPPDACLDAEADPPDPQLHPPLHPTDPKILVPLLQHLQLHAPDMVLRTPRRAS